MSRESSEADYFSSSADVGLRESARSSNGYSDSGSDLTASRGLSSKESETEENKIDNITVSDLNTSNENQREFNAESGPLSSLKVTSHEELSGTTKPNDLTRKVSYQTGPSTKRASSPDPLKGPLTRRVSSVDPLEGPSTRRVSPVSPPVGHLTRTTWLGRQGGGSFISICRLNSETEMNEPTNSETLTDQNVCFRILTWLGSFLRHCSKVIRLSRFYLLLHVALFSIPISAGYMGAKYHPLCEGCPNLPAFVNAQGILGMCLLFVRLADIVSKLYLTPHLTGHEMDFWLVALIIPFCGFLVILMTTTYTCDPVFLPRVSTMKDFCYKVFYDYAYYLNVVVLSILLLMFLIHIPGCFDPVEDAEEE